MQSAPRTPTYGGPAVGNWPPVDDTRRLDAYASPAAPPENPWAHMQIGSSAVAAAPSGAAPCAVAAAPSGAAPGLTRKPGK